jgi:hypothetical protein
MECPFCKSVIATTYRCEGCGADLHILRQLKDIRARSGHDPAPIADHISPSDETPDHELSETSTFESRGDESADNVFFAEEQLPVDSAPGFPSLGPFSSFKLNEVDSLFDQLFASLSETSPMTQTEISAADVIIKERTEQVELLFELLQGSLVSSDLAREKVKTESSIKLSGKNSPRINFSNAAPEQFFTTIRENHPSPVPPSEQEQHVTPSALNRWLAGLIDGVLSQLPLFAALVIQYDFSLLRAPTLATVADDLFCLSLLIFFLVPSFLFFRGAFVFFVGSTPGRFITGIHPMKPVW